VFKQPEPPLSVIITRTPYRISFFGGGTDYPSWYRNNGGQVLSTTIDKYVYITCRDLPPFFDHRVRLAYSQVEECYSADELQHPSASAALRFLNINDGVEIHYDGDLPSRSGIGSSSAFTVGLLKTLHAYKGEMISAAKLAQEATYLEQQVIGETVGSQDQISAAFGGLNRIEFPESGPPIVTPVIMRADRRSELEGNLMLFFTGIVRTAADVAATYGDGSKQRKSLGNTTRLVDEALELLGSEKDLDGFGELLDQGWNEKRKLSNNVSTQQLDRLYSRGCEAGAVGGKLTGAGGGGMLLFYVPAERQNDVKNALSELLLIPIKFETAGCQVIFFSEFQDRFPNRTQ